MGFCFSYYRLVQSRVPLYKIKTCVQMKPSIVCPLVRLYCLHTRCPKICADPFVCSKTYPIYTLIIIMHIFHNLQNGIPLNVKHIFLDTLYINMYTCISSDAFVRPSNVCYNDTLTWQAELSGHTAYLTLLFT